MKFEDEYERDDCPYAKIIAGVDMPCSDKCPFGTCLESIFDDANRIVSAKVTAELTKVISDYLKEQSEGKDSKTD